MDQGTCTFPGVKQVVSATMSLTHGISPSVCVMEIVPQDTGIQETGTLAFHYGNVSIMFPDSKVAEGTIERSRAGLIWRFSIYDRRWKWRYGSISGHYNIHREANATGAILDSSQEGEIVNILDWSKRTPSQLAALCLDAMGEINYDTSRLPRNIYPEVHWDEIPPAEALSRLCDMFGCIITIGVNNWVMIYKKGVGGPLPMFPILSGGKTMDPDEGPDEIEIVCGPTLYQKDWELEAVGIDNDLSRTLVPVDDLAYKPTAGWEAENPETFNNVTTAPNRELAQRSVWRMYRLATPANVNGKKVKRREQILPIGTEQVFLHLDDGTVQYVPAAVYGNYYLWNDAHENAVACTRYQRPFSINANLGVVVFSEPVFYLDGSNFTAATMTLRTTVPYRDPDTLAWDRYRHVVSTGRNRGTKRLLVTHDELQLCYNIGQPVNLMEIKLACQHYAVAILKMLQTEYPESAVYPGLLLQPLDGAIQNVTWIVGTGGATTTVSRNTEQYLYVRPYYMRRQVQQAEMYHMTLGRLIRGAWKWWFRK